MADRAMAKSGAQGAAVLALKPQVASPQAGVAPSAARRERWEDTVAVVTVRGDLDRDGLEAIDFAVGRAAGEAGRVVLDLLEVSHLDYAGVGTLIQRRRELSGRGGDLVIAVRNPYVANILRAAGGAELLLCRSVEEASGAVSVVAAARARPHRRAAKP